MELLPGLTNVTDRARYYSLYPWVLWSYEASGGKLDQESVIRAVRAADCLLTLIAERHAHKLAEHITGDSIGMIGRDTLVPALQRLETGDALRLSDYSGTAESERRYFKNKFGGLGQYYRGTLFDLQILNSAEGQVPGYTALRGAAIAKAVDAGVPGDLFWRTLNRDTISIKALDDLYAFCPCQLSTSNANMHGYSTYSSPKRRTRVGRNSFERRYCSCSRWRSNSGRRGSGTSMSS